MVVSRRRIAAVFSGCLLISVAVGSGAIGAGLASAAPDATACIAALRADRDEGIRISNEQTDQFNLTTAGSALEKAATNMIKYLKLSNNDLYKAFQYAYRGQKTAANSWVKQSNAAVALYNKAVTASTAEVNRINAKTKQINADFDKLNAQMTATDEACLGL